MCSMIRKRCCTVVRDALNPCRRIIGGSIINTCSLAGAATTTTQHLSSLINSHHRHFCTDSKKLLINQKLVQTIEALHKSPLPEAVVPPANFPFTIEENPLKNEIILTRELDGELIRVAIDMPYNRLVRRGNSRRDRWRVNSKMRSHDRLTNEEEKESISATISWELEPTQTHHEGEKISLRVEISRPNRSNYKLGFTVTASTNDDHNIRIYNALVYGPPPPEDHLHNDLCLPVGKGGRDFQKALREFLEIRGIDKTLVRFLHDYMTKHLPLEMLEKVEKFSS